MPMTYIPDTIARFWYQKTGTRTWHQFLVPVARFQVPDKKWYQIAWHTYQILVPVFWYRNLVRMSRAQDNQTLIHRCIRFAVVYLLLSVKNQIVPIEGSNDVPRRTSGFVLLLLMQLTAVNSQLYRTAFILSRRAAAAQIARHNQFQPVNCICSGAYLFFRPPSSPLHPILQARRQPGVWIRHFRPFFTRFHFGRRHVVDVTR